MANNADAMGGAPSETEEERRRRKEREAEERKAEERKAEERKAEERKAAEENGGVFSSPDYPVGPTTGPPAQLPAPDLRAMLLREQQPLSTPSDSGAVLRAALANASQPTQPAPASAFEAAAAKERTDKDANADPELAKAYVTEDWTIPVDKDRAALARIRQRLGIGPEVSDEDVATTKTWREAARGDPQTPEATTASTTPGGIEFGTIPEGGKQPGVNAPYDGSMVDLKALGISRADQKRAEDIQYKMAMKNALTSKMMRADLRNGGSGFYYAGEVATKDQLGQINWDLDRLRDRDPEFFAKASGGPLPELPAEPRGGGGAGRPSPMRPTGGGGGAFPSSMPSQDARITALRGSEAPAAQRVPIPGPDASLRDQILWSAQPGPGGYMTDPQTGQQIDLTPMMQQDQGGSVALWNRMYPKARVNNTSELEAMQAYLKSLPAAAQNAVLVEDKPRQPSAEEMAYQKVAGTERANRDGVQKRQDDAESYFKTEIGKAAKNGKVSARDAQDIADAAVRKLNPKTEYEAEIARQALLRQLGKPRNPWGPTPPQYDVAQMSQTGEASGGETAIQQLHSIAVSILGPDMADKFMKDMESRGATPQEIAAVLEEMSTRAQPK